MAAVPVNVQKLSVTGESTGIEASQYRRRDYYVVTLSAPDTNGGRIARQATGPGVSIPQPGTQFPGTGLVVLTTAADPETGDQSGVNYVVTVESGINVYLFASPTGAPWLKSDKIGFHDKEYERVWTIDFNTDGAKNSGNPRPIVNSAKQHFANPLMRRFINPLLRIRRARLQGSFNVADAKSCIDSLNQGAFSINRQAGPLTVPVEKACLRSCVVEDAAWTDGTLYYDITMEIELEGQISLKFLHIQDKGFYCFATVAGSEKLVHCINPVEDPNNPGTYLKGSDGNYLYVPVNNEVFLATRGGKPGHRLPDALDPTAANGYADLEFTHYPTLSWATWIN